MKSLMRATLLACVAITVAEPANAQFFDWFGGNDSPRQARPRAAPRVQQQQRGVQRAPQRVQRYSPTPWSNFVDDDDDDDRPQRRGAARGLALGPAILDGGPRPSISPATPATVSFSGYAAGNIVIDSGGRALYYVVSDNRAYRYPIAVGREGFSWTGTEKVSRKAAWPDWHPPREMRERDPRLPEKMTGGLRNPLGAQAIYLGNTLYRIHGTNDARSIGGASSSCCFRMTNAHVMHLSSLVSVGTSVHVVSRLPATVKRNVAGL